MWDAQRRSRNRGSSIRLTASGEQRGLRMALLDVARSRIRDQSHTPRPVSAGKQQRNPIALTSDETRVVVVNHDANSLSIIQVKNKNGKDVGNKIAEIPVGEEPRYVAVSPDDRFAFVTNAISATVSVVHLAQKRVVKEIQVGTEPRA